MSAPPPVVADRFDPRAGELLRRSIVTPDGVPLVFTVARAGDRAAAFVLDGILVLAAILAIVFLCAVVGADTLTSAIALLAIFLLRNGYFLWFELRGQGRTPGKRRLGLRVIDAHGQPLRGDAVIVRNLTREVEVFLPIVVLSDPEVLVSAGPGWVRALAVLWLGVFLFFPFFSRERRRIGDLLAGTLVVREPRARLEHDVGDRGARAGGRDADLEFSPRQLALYGIYELQVLEEVLRNPDRREELAAVAAAIRRKIGWPDSGPEVSARVFLEAFYRAQRVRLEHDLLLGKARERKRRGRLRN